MTKGATSNVMTGEACILSLDWSSVILAMTIYHYEGIRLGLRGFDSCTPDGLYEQDFTDQSVSLRPLYPWQHSVSLLTKSEDQIKCSTVRSFTYLGGKSDFRKRRKTG